MAIDPNHPAPERQLDIEDAVGGRRIGYARVSTEDQSLARQMDSLTAAGCVRIHSDKLSGGSRARPGLDACLADLRAGDTLVVHDISRLGRSLPDLLDIVRSLGERGVGFRSLGEPFMDTASPQGVFLIQVFGALAQFEKSLIQTRVREGIKSKIVAQGGAWGRRKALNPAQIEEAVRMRMDGLSYERIGRLFNVSGAAVWRVLNGATRKPRKADTDTSRGN